MLPPSLLRTQGMRVSMDRSNHPADNGQGGDDLATPGELRRVYADFNALNESPWAPDRLGIPLTMYGTLHDLARQGLRLKVGLRLTVYSDSDVDEDLEATATVRFDKSNGTWFAEFDPEGFRYAPRGDWDHGPLRCWACAQDIDTPPLDPGERCPRCGERLHAPMDPPGPA